MYGLGILAPIMNILPFAGLIVAPFTRGRGGLTGNRVAPVYRNYYRAFWFRALFGKHIKITYPALLLFFVGTKYLREVRKNELSYAIITNYDILGLEYDEEENKFAKAAFEKYKLESLYRKNYLMFSNEKALHEYKNKAAVFDEYISKQE